MDMLEVSFHFTPPLKGEHHDLLIALAEASGGYVGGGGEDMAYSCDHTWQLARFTLGVSVLVSSHQLPAFKIDDTDTETTEDAEEFPVPVEGAPQAQ